jgi:hypothetical protein
VRADSIHVCHNWQDAEPAGRKLKGPKHSTWVNIKARRAAGAALGALLRELVARNPYRDGFVLWAIARAAPSATIIERHYYAGLRQIGIGRGAQAAQSDVPRLAAFFQFLC